MAQSDNDWVTGPWVPGPRAAQGSWQVEYRFERLAAVNTDAVIAAALNEWLGEGWVVVSHAYGEGEYSFVLKKATPRQAGSNLSNK